MLTGGAAVTLATRKYAEELVALAPDAILGTGSSATVGLLLQVTRIVPIVFAYVPDPVGCRMGTRRNQACSPYTASGHHPRSCRLWWGPWTPANV